MGYKIVLHTRTQICSLVSFISKSKIGQNLRMAKLPSGPRLINNVGIVINKVSPETARIRLSKQVEIAKFYRSKTEYQDIVAYDPIGTANTGDIVDIERLRDDNEQILIARQKNKSLESSFLIKSILEKGDPELVNQAMIEHNIVKLFNKKTDLNEKFERIF